MVVTDLHGDWDAYRRYRDRFITLQAKGQADYLILTGDLIHATNPEADRSIEIVLDVLALRAEYGPAIIYLCGNHEMPHIYGLSLAKGNQVYTPDFERALGQSQPRQQIIDLFSSLPFYLRTKAGVSLTHAGAPARIAEPANAPALFNWSHQAIRDQARDVLEGEDLEALRSGYTRLYGDSISYESLARYYLAVSGPEDPRYNDLLSGFIVNSFPSFDQLLWPALFTRCEKEYGLADYSIFLDALLQELSTDFYSQQFLVSGHIRVNNGYQIIARRQLRLASAEHATPREAGRYLLFDTEQPVKNIQDLLSGLGTVYT